MDMTFRIPYDEGYYYAMEVMFPLPSRNPYPAGTQAYRDWLNGLYDCLLDDEEEWYDYDDDDYYFW